jgi:hypothetical protein
MVTRFVVPPSLTGICSVPVIAPSAGNSLILSAGILVFLAEG